MKKTLCTLTGTVVQGQGKGHSVGMPTANLRVPENTVLPKHGVYVAKIDIAGIIYTGLTHIGLRPSVDASEAVTIETYIMDFSENIYGKTISIYLCLYLRGTQKFDSLDAVKRQVEIDCMRAKRFFS